MDNLPFIAEQFGYIHTLADTPSCYASFQVKEWQEDTLQRHFPNGTYLTTLIRLLQTPQDLFLHLHDTFYDDKYDGNGEDLLQYSLHHFFLPLHDTMEQKSSLWMQVIMWCYQAMEDLEKDTTKPFPQIDPSDWTETCLPLVLPCLEQMLKTAGDGIANDRSMDVFYGDCETITTNISKGVSPLQDTQKDYEIIMDADVMQVWYDDCLMLEYDSEEKSVLVSNFTKV